MPSRPPTALPRFQGVVVLGCAGSLVGLLLVVAGGVVSKVGGPNDAIRVLVLLGLFLVAGGLATTIISGVYGSRRVTRRLRELAWPTYDGADGPPMVRELESRRFATTASIPEFPTKVVIDSVLGEQSGSSRILVNAPPAAQRRRDRVIEPASIYQWVMLSEKLPTLILSRDFSGQHSVIGLDFDVENHEFNRRFRVDSAMPGQLRKDKARYDEFARYASAMLHPRAIEILLDLPQDQWLIVTGTLVGSIGPLHTSEARFAAVADVLRRFADAIPEHVIRRWGGSPDYAPGD